MSILTPFFVPFLTPAGPRIPGLREVPARVPDLAPDPGSDLPQDLPQPDPWDLPKNHEKSTFEPKSATWPKNLPRCQKMAPNPKSGRFWTSDLASDLAQTWPQDLTLDQGRARLGHPTDLRPAG